MSKRIIILTLMALSVLLIAVVGRERALSIVFGPLEIRPLDFSSLILGPKPNQFLVCPRDYCSAKPHMISPTFSVSVDVLQQRWLAMLEKLPRIERGNIDVSIMQHEFIQRSAVMRYPDSITVRFISLESGHATLAIYSRSHYGHSDLGVNENRVRTWLAALEKI